MYNVYSSRIQTITNRIPIVMEAKVFKTESNTIKIEPKVIETEPANIKTESTEFACTICNEKSYANRSDLVQHIRLHFLVYVCSTCNEKIVGNVAYEFHLKQHDTEIRRSGWQSKTIKNRSLICDYCNNVSPSKKLIMRHMRENHPKLYYRPKKQYGRFNFVCDYDQEHFYRKNELQRHFREKHHDIYIRKKVYTGPYTCSQCGLVVRDLRNHMMVHTDKQFMCDVCGKKFFFWKKNTEKPYFDFYVAGKSFRKKLHLQGHRITHTDIKDFKCEICGKAFHIRHGLITHRRTHTRERIYKCPYCENRYIHSTDLRRHRRVHPEHVEEPRFKCEWCPKRFYENKFLVQHMRSHNK